MHALTADPAAARGDRRLGRVRWRARARAATAVAALGIALVASGSAPASAATTQSGACVDGGGVRWSARAVWGDTYLAADGTRRVTIDYAGWSTSRPGVVPTDSVVRTYDGTGTLLQVLSWTGPFDYQSGSAYRARNPVNPPSSPGRTRVTVTVGVDGDGFGNCTVTFLQPSAAPPSSSDTYENDVVTATNRERTSRGLTPLTPEACVDRYAEAQAKRMAAENRMYHQDLGPILAECNLSTVGENVAYGYSTGAAVTAAWMNSTGHRANILNPRFRLIGVGATQNASGRWYVAQVFGAYR